MKILACILHKNVHFQLKEVEEYMRYRKLPPDLKLRVHEYYNQRYHGQFFNEECILQELSHSLNEVIEYGVICNKFLIISMFSCDYRTL